MEDNENLDSINNADKYGDDWDSVDLSNDFTEHSKVVERLNAPHVEKA